MAEAEFNFHLNYNVTEAEIQLPLKRFPDSSVSSLIRAGWWQEEHHHHHHMRLTSVTLNITHS